MRRYIADNLDEFNSIVNSPAFKETPGGVLGEKNKRIDTEFTEALEKQPLIANKQFYWFFKLAPEVLMSERLVKELTDRYERTLPLNNFLLEALSWQ